MASLAWQRGHRGDRSARLAGESVRTSCGQQPQRSGFVVFSQGCCHPRHDPLGAPSGAGVRGRQQGRPSQRVELGNSKQRSDDRRQAIQPTKPMLLFCEDVQQPSDQASDTRVSMSNHRAQRPARGACHPIRLKLLECSLDRFGQHSVASSGSGYRIGHARERLAAIPRVSDGTGDCQRAWDVGSSQHLGLAPARHVLRGHTLGAAIVCVGHVP